MSSLFQILDKISTDDDGDQAQESSTERRRNLITVVFMLSIPITLHLTVGLSNSTIEQRPDVLAF